MLEAFCERRGLTVNLVKTKVMLLAGVRGSEAAEDVARLGRVTFGGKRLPVVSEFCYLGIVFNSGRSLAAVAAPARCIAGRVALQARG